MSVARQHAEWLSLMDVSGPFLSVSVLREAFPNGLITHDSALAAELRAAHDAWSDPEEAGHEDVDAVHRAFVGFVLHRVLEFPETDWEWNPERLRRYAVQPAVHPVELMSTAVLMEDNDAVTLLMVTDRDVPVDQPVPGEAWTAAPRERMVELLRGTGCPLGLVTDGERWTVVSWRDGEAPGYATWWASLWREERITLQSFRTLLRAPQFFAVPEEETLVGLLERSTEDQSAITTRLGNQTLEAVEILIRRIDQLDRDRGGRLLADVPETDLYDAAVTVMMRLIFLFFAEENDLLPMGERLWVEQYAASTLRAWLQEAADKHGEEVLESESDAWPRLLATWRAVYAGVEHADMRLSPYGGSLFDPDRYPFLEGRLPGTTWREAPADPLPIDNRTVLHLLSALQTLKEGGQRRRLSFRALDVEQIGHVYEGMLDHTAARAEGWVLGLSGIAGREPKLSLDELEALDDEDLVSLLKDRTGRNASTIRSWLDADPDAEIERRFGLYWMPALAGGRTVANRVRRFAKFIRTDSTGGPTVFQPGSVYVCDSSHRGATGTHYTPRSFTEAMVKETLAPLVYDGIAEGKPENQWRVRTPDEILSLKVGDPACGSGAFLVQACRFLASKLVESRLDHGELDREATEEHLVAARREVVGRCLYGVDVNPMAVEMAKLSLWLVTLARDKPFSFVDHAIRVGDSLVGLTNLDQLRYWSLSGDGEVQELFAKAIVDDLDKVRELRTELEASPVLDSTDAERKAWLLKSIEDKLERLRALADLLFAASFATENPQKVDRLRASALLDATLLLDNPQQLHSRASLMLNGVLPFHWALEFPEVFGCGGFNAIVGNPPFMGGQGITGTFGRPFREYLVEHIADGVRGSADLAAYFFLRACSLLTEEGNLGLLAVNTIAEGDTRRVGLEQILAQGLVIFAAHVNESWPNAAAVTTSRIHAHKGGWRGSRKLNDDRVSHISAFLSKREDWSPKKLVKNMGYSFQGTNILGTGFLLSVDDAKRHLHGCPRDELVLLPFVNGHDLNQSPEQKPARWAICFWDWSLQRARKHPQLLRIVEAKVRPGRQKITYNPRARDRWWSFHRSTPDLYHAIGRGAAFDEHPHDWDPSSRQLERVVIAAQTGKYLSVSLVPNDMLFSHMTVVFSSDSTALLGLLNSSIHFVWVQRNSATLETRLRYLPSDCFETFPLPVHGELPGDRDLEDLGERFDVLRRTLMARENIGLTDLYNRFHDRIDCMEDLDDLRYLQVEIDERVLELYGWGDIDLAHDFREVPYLPENDRVRLAISEAARLEILDRLGRLNRERYEWEVANGLHGRKRGGGRVQTKAATSLRSGTSSRRKRAARASRAQGGLFDGEAD